MYTAVPKLLTKFVSLRRSQTLHRTKAKRTYVHLFSLVLKAYADWRTGATAAEKRAQQPGDGVILTFDDYCTRTQAERLMAILDETNVQAMMFIQGDWYETHKDLVEEMRRAGHLIGNHTYSHPDLLSLSDEDVRREIASSVPSPWLRPPMGRYNARIRRIAKQCGATIAYWTIDSDDWRGATAGYMMEKIMSQLKSDSVILFHLHSDETARLLPRLIAAIRERGYDLPALRHESTR